MCGIVGMVGRGPVSPREDALRRMEPFKALWGQQ
jgi:hypothetical protein